MLRPVFIEQKPQDGTTRSFGLKLASLWNFSVSDSVLRAGNSMIAFLLWCILFVVCWPLALVALVLYPFVWLLLLPFRIAGIAVHGALALVWAIVMLPARLLSAPFRLA
jgi:ABC-type multidrug transport system fused ATPase/permease subunit